MSAAFVLDQVIANGGSTLGLPRHEVTAPAVEAAFVQYEGQMQPALLLEDGSALVMSFAQVEELRRVFFEWNRLFLRAPSQGRTRMEVKR